MNTEPLPPNEPLRTTTNAEEPSEPPHPVMVEEPAETRTPRRRFSAEGVVGTGVSIAMLGLLCLLLGWAQVMRHVPTAGWILLGLGALFLVAGVLTAFVFPRDRAASAPADADV